jgi:ammonia channel protein AmtB
LGGLDRRLEGQGRGCIAGLVAAANLAVAIALAVVDGLAVALAVAVLLLLLRYDTNCQDSVDRISKMLNFNLRPSLSKAAL